MKFFALPFLVSGVFAALEPGLVAREPLTSSPTSTITSIKTSSTPCTTLISSTRVVYPPCPTQSCITYGPTTTTYSTVLPCSPIASAPSTTALCTSTFTSTRSGTVTACPAYTCAPITETVVSTSTIPCPTTTISTTIITTSTSPTTTPTSITTPPGTGPCTFTVLSSYTAIKDCFPTTSIGTCSPGPTTITVTSTSSGFCPTSTPISTHCDTTITTTLGNVTRDCSTSGSCGPTTGLLTRTSVISGPCPTTSSTRTYCISTLTTTTGYITSDCFPTTAAGCTGGIYPQTSLYTTLANCTITKTGSTSSTSSTISTTTTTSTPLSQLQTHWGQCGGLGYNGPTSCLPTYTCSPVAPTYYSQCL
ncbi:hypothetical protein SISNIDRAFT_1696 [Sistotremastrum niveocremeum HHB9708]|uniref:CBM1 domain-containing protein n=2 Tax=Sistotremastraceae TaxID=3402574 RepID=A0A165AD08_9AGAM|nr:hypothetical protein SISNIDRAFT_1696 [Sistotremastrum niveocremeum HHB9708]KZT36188.1 hypothetical protein SISSUDRAFT_87441 [Sistotremastrum suecicum HHB10207 ss-3]